MSFEQKRRSPVGIGITVREWRKERDLSLREAAVITGIPKGHLSRIESGERPDPRMSTLLKLSHGMEITVDELVSASQTEAATA